jgi:hypothetical protein
VRLAKDTLRDLTTESRGKALLKLYRVICLGMVFALDMPQASAAWADSLFLTADHTRETGSESPVTATGQTSLPEKLSLHQRLLRARMKEV